jgi:hypothetical protein
MNINRVERRATQYAELGTVLGLTSAGIGISIPTEDQYNWSNTLARLATADDISETTPEKFSDPRALLDMLDLNPDDPILNDIAAELLAASRASREAPNLVTHFSSRRREAIACIDLLRYQSSPDVRDNSSLWSQLGTLTIVGTYFDSFVDCREDAMELPQFTAAQLAQGSLLHFLKAMRGLHSNTVISCAKACRCVGIHKLIVRRLPKPLLGPNLYSSVPYLSR